MKKCVFLLFLILLLGSPDGLYAVQDQFDEGQSRMTAGETLFNLGIWALTHPDAIKSITEMSQEEKKEKTPLDKKVDEAINKAWAEK